MKSDPLFYKYDTTQKKYVPAPSEGVMGAEILQKILNEKGLLFVIEGCKSWLENKEEQLRAYSPEDKDERAALRRTIEDLENSIKNYLKS